MGARQKCLKKPKASIQVKTHLNPKLAHTWWVELYDSPENSPENSGLLA